MRFYFTIFFLFIISPFFAQENLVPNGGFEEHQGESVLLWEHALSPFYHFAPFNITPHSGSNCMGLCIWKYDPTEYLQVKLTEKLEKGATYEIKMFVKYDPNINDCWSDFVNELGCYFSDTSFHLKNRMQLFVKPQAEITLDDKQIWVEKKETFTAGGSEQYLVIGRYFDYTTNPKDSAYIRSRILMNKKLDSIENVQETKINAVVSSIKKKYAKGFTDLDKIKNKKKRQKKMNEFRISVSKMGYEIQAATVAIEKQYASQIGKLNVRKYCRIRINIDDITLTKTAAKKTVEFSDTIIAGKTFRLKNIFFDTDKSELLDNSFVELDKLFLLLKDNDSLKIEISGHTDSTGIEAHNLLLSEARAKAVVDYLIVKGIDKSRITYKGKGSSSPIATNKTLEGRAENRRVEFEVKK